MIDDFTGERSAGRKLNLQQEFDAFRSGQAELQPEPNVKWHRSPNYVHEHDWSVRPPQDWTQLGLSGTEDEPPTGAGSPPGSAGSRGEQSQAHGARRLSAPAALGAPSVEFDEPESRLAKRTCRIAVAAGMRQLILDTPPPLYTHNKHHYRPPFAELKSSNDQAAGEFFDSARHRLASVKSSSVQHTLEQARTEANRLGERGSLVKVRTGDRASPAIPVYSARKPMTRTLKPFEFHTDRRAVERSGVRA